MLTISNKKNHLKIADSIFENSPISILIVSNKGNILNANKSALVLFDSAFHELESHSVLNLIPDVKDFFPQLWWQKIFTRNKSELITQIETKNGKKIPVKVFCQYQVDDDINLLYISNVTSTSNVNNELIKPEDNLLAYFNSTSEIICIVGLNKIIVSYNKIFEHYIYLVFGKDVKTGDLIAKYQIPGTEFDFDKNFDLAKNGQEVRFEREMYHNKLSIWWAVTFLPVKNGVGEIIGVAYILQNIDDRKIAEELLLKSEERFKLVVQGSNDGWWDWDLVHNQLFYSPKWWKILGYENNELVNLANYWEKLIHPNDLGRVQSVFNSAIKSTSDKYEVEFMAMHKSGNFIPLLSKGYILRNDAGVAIRVSGADIDLSEQKKQALTLLENERKLKISQKTALIGNYEIDLTTQEWKGSEMIYQILGLEQQKISNLSDWLGFVHFQFWDKVSQLYQNAIANKEPFSFEYKIVMYQSQEFKWVADYANIDYDDSGNAIRIIGALQDITERKAISDNLYKNEIKYRSLLENMDFGILEVDTNDVIMRAYPKFCEMLGYTEDELIGKKANEIFLPNWQKDEFEKATNVRKNGVSHAYQMQLITKNKNIIDVIISGTPTYNQQGKLCGSVGIHFNISNQKKLETQLRESKVLFETIFNQTSSAMLLLKPDSGLIVLANNAAFQLLNKSKEQVVNQLISTVGLSNNQFDKVHQLLQTKNQLPKYQLLFEINGNQVSFEINARIVEITNEKYCLIVL